MLPAHGEKEKTLLELTAFEEEEGGPAFYSVAPQLLTSHVAASAQQCCVVVLFAPLPVVTFVLSPWFVKSSWGGRVHPPVPLLLFGIKGVGRCGYKSFLYGWTNKMT